MESLYSLKPWLVKFLASKSQTFVLRSRSLLVAVFLENVESRWFLNHKKLSTRLWFFMFKIMFSLANLALSKIRITNNSSRFATRGCFGLQ